MTIYIKDYWVESMPRKAVVLFFLAVAIMFGGCPCADAENSIRVGVYNFKPLVFIDESGQPKGFFVDILDHVANEEGWKITYVPGSWKDCLSRLENGEIDLLMSTGYSEERARYLDFTSPHLFLDWGIIYMKKGSGVETVLDLRGRTVGALKGSIYTAQFKGLLEQFDIRCNFLELDEYTQVLQSVEDGQSDAGICTNVYGMLIESSYHLDRAGIVFSPTKIGFAVRKDHHHDIMAALDSHFAALKADRSSVYYSLYDKWMELPKRKEALPAWLIPAMGALAFTLLLLFSLNLFLKRQVNVKTAELRKAYRELSLSEERFRRTFEQSAAGIAHVTPDGRFIRINDRFCDIVGYTRTEMLNLTFQAITHPDDLDLDLENVRRILSNEIENYAMEKRYHHKNGSIVWVNLTVSLERNDSGEPKYFIAVVQDITHHKVIDEKLRQSEARYRRIVDTANEGIMTEEAGHGITYANRVMADMLGYGVDELIGRPIVDFLFDEEHADHELRMERRGRGMDEKYERRFRRKDGGELWTIVSTKPVMSEDGRFTVSFGMYTDITERKRAEQALRESEISYRTLCENLPGIVYRIIPGEHRYYKLYNSMLEKLTGVSAEYLRAADGPLLQPWILSEDGSAVCMAFEQAFREGRPFEMEYRISDREGRIRHLSEICRPITGFDGAITHSDGLIFDITEQKRLEDQLRHMQKMEAIGTLAGGIAHDFNNILAAIIGYTELAIAEVSRHSSMRFNLDEVLKASHRAKDLVRQILMFSRMEGQGDQTPVQVSLVVKEALKLLRSILPTTIEIQHDIQCSDGMVLADATQIHQVLVNICTNAAHAMEENGGTLKVRLTEIDLDAEQAESALDLSSGRYLKLGVSDTGHGMDQSILGRIFEPYFTTKEVGKGTGLGLAVVHGIIQRHGGAIAVWSRPGEGSSFDIFLPKIESIALDNEQEPLPVTGSSERILFVDDEQSLVEMARRMLGYLGYDVVGATSSTEALEIFRSQPDRFDLVITDYTMPFMTGAELAKSIIAIRADIPIVMCTGYTEGINIEKVKAIGIRELAHKPLSMQEIGEALRRILGSR